MKSFIIILLLCVFGGSKLFAQKTEFIASAPSVVEVGEQFRLSFVLNAKGENLQVPTIKGFDLLAGPSLSTSSNITIINGDMKQNQEYTYTYILEGQEEGEFTIEPATITVDTVVPFSFKWKNFSIYSLLPWVYAGLRTACIMLRLAPARIATRPDRPAQRASGAAHPIRTVADYSLWRQRERVRE